MATATESNPKFDKLAGELESWSIMEISQFGKYLQERWGVSAAPVAVAAAPGGGGGAAAAEVEEKTEFTVVEGGQGPRRRGAEAGQGEHRQGRGERRQEEARGRRGHGRAQVTAH